MTKPRTKEDLLAEIAELEKQEAKEAKLKPKVVKPKPKPKVEVVVPKPEPRFKIVECRDCDYKANGKIPFYRMFVKKGTNEVLCQKCFAKEMNK